MWWLWYWICSIWKKLPNLTAFCVFSRRKCCCCFTVLEKNNEKIIKLTPPNGLPVLEQGDFAGGSLMAGAEVPSLEGGREVNVEDLSHGSLEMEDWKWRMYFCWGGVFYDQRNMCYFFLGKNVRAKVKDSGNSKLGSVSEYRLLHMILVIGWIYERGVYNVLKAMDGRTLVKKRQMRRDLMIIDKPHEFQQFQSRKESSWQDLLSWILTYPRYCIGIFEDDRFSELPEIAEIGWDMFSRWKTKSDTENKLWEMVIEIKQVTNCVAVCFEFVGKVPNIPKTLEKISWGCHVQQEAHQARHQSTSWLRYVSLQIHHSFHSTCLKKPSIT